MSRRHGRMDGHKVLSARSRKPKEMHKKSPELLQGNNTPGGFPFGSLPREILDMIYLWLGIPVGGLYLHQCDLNCSCYQELVQERKKRQREAAMRIPALAFFHLLFADSGFESFRDFEWSSLESSPHLVKLQTPREASLLLRGVDADGIMRAQQLEFRTQLPFVNSFFYYDIQGLLYQGSFVWTGLLDPRRRYTGDRLAIALGTASARLSGLRHAELRCSRYEADKFATAHAHNMACLASFAPSLQSLCVRSSVDGLPKVGGYVSRVLQQSIGRLAHKCEKLETVTLSFGSADKNHEDLFRADLDLKNVEKEDRVSKAREWMVGTLRFAREKYAERIAATDQR
ncbi:hypothetical protein BDV96DRAFT_594931 [Lophiotrema nucula]|uniref:Uncharacterized protein n=1 Tax=Lophiotrema nucula TaxID=690887 RepID=A0A6A5ZLJ4_9PLEO|nr:hypothetical protein BDV96DRAFT_594931 [Lophiotrema nucula]